MSRMTDRLLDIEEREIELVETAYEATEKALPDTLKQARDSLLELRKENKKQRELVVLLRDENNQFHSTAQQSKSYVIGRVIGATLSGLVSIGLKLL